MASNRCDVFGVVLVMVMVMVTLSVGATDTTCENVIVSLSPCLNYVRGNVLSPSHDCCLQLADVVKSKPLCLCELVTGDQASMGVKVNETLAIGLPYACEVHTPPVSRCVGNRSKTVPPTTSMPPAKSDGTRINLPFYFSFGLLLVASNLCG